MRKSFQKPSSAAAVSTVGSKCQKCLKEGHWTADCPNERVYKSRPSRSALLFNPKLKLPEASLIKDDFIDERNIRENKEKDYDSDSVYRNDDNFNEIPDVNIFTEQLIKEVKESQNFGENENKINIKDREFVHREARFRENYRAERSRLRSRSPTYRSRRRQSRTRSRSNSNSSSSESNHRVKIQEKSLENNTKKYSKYASDSDFSSDSE